MTQSNATSQPLDPAEILKMADEITRVVDGGHHKAYGTNPYQTTMTAGNAWWRTVADAMRAYAQSETASARFCWVPVGERKPHLLRPVITSDGETVRPAYRTGEDSWSAWPASAKVTHWSDYPEAPK